MPASYLFVYGTLRRGSNNESARLLQGQSRFVGNARMQGRLYGLGRYPGAVAAVNPGEWVRGEVYNMDDATRLLAALDDYEGSDFERAVATVQLDDGSKVECWVYLYVGKTPGRLIASGDWFSEPV
ncbi:MAG TPA: gamma-glutamylcyclotransferase family protein [Bryobacteraceae bacterium]|nr:gamma-glutamylcyclotransferase family protein [Bryobacteraceae bacterium]